MSKLDEPRILWLYERINKTFDIELAILDNFINNNIHYFKDFIDRNEINSCIIIYSLLKENTNSNDSKDLHINTDIINNEISQENENIVENDEKENINKKVNFDSYTNVTLNITTSYTNDINLQKAQRTLYLIKTVDKVISPKLDENTDSMMCRSVEYGVLPGHSLSMLEGVLKNVYLPLFDPESLSHEENSEKQSLMFANLGETVRNEFTSNFHKFVSQISHAIQQVNGDVHLTIPNVNITNPSDASQDIELIPVLEYAVESWSSIIVQVIAQEQHKQLVGQGPISEINFWRSRNAALSCLYEQLQTETIQKIVQTLEYAQSDLIIVFKEQLAELTKLYEEAKNNVKFLATLERNFKNISSGNLTTIMETIPSMMNNLKMVWVISRHYNKDERMSQLMHLIAVEIAEKVAKEINIRTIFRRRPEDAMNIIRKGKDVLDSWYRTYMQVREKIEGSDSKDRWDFDKKKLFEQTNHMSRICENLYSVALTLDQFYKFLGPELKQVTGDSAGIDEVLDHVKGSITPLENLPFNVFNRQYQTSWDQVMKSFNEKVEEIENKTKQFIDTSFQKLRSAEGAFDLLTNFKNIECRPSIREQMLNKFTNILEQYSREVERVATIFHSHKAKPPCSKNQPPVAGAILWSRSLYYRIKKTIIRFQEHGTLLKSDIGKEVCNQYIVIAKEINDFEEKLLKDWESSVKTTVETNLKLSILRKVPLANGVTNFEGLPFIDYEVVVNFAPELKQLIRETRYLEKMGIAIPDAALNVTLQEQGYYNNSERLLAMISSLSEILTALTDVERQVLSVKIGELGLCLKPSFGTLNWNSLAIEDFIGNCIKAIKEFQDVLHQIQKNADMIEAVVKAIRTATLINLDEFADRKSNYRIDNLFENIERSRSSTVEALVVMYDQTVTQCLEKIETLVTGKAAANVALMAPYFAYWEKRVYDAITKMVVGGIHGVQQLLFPRRSKAAIRHRHLGKEKPRALILVQAEMNGSDIMITPSSQDLDRLGNLPRLILDSAKSFIRWMRGTCTRCKPIQMKDDETYIFTFHEDVSRSPVVLRIVTSLKQALFKVFQMVQQYIESWTLYDSRLGLWNAKKLQTVEKQRLKSCSVVEFDRKISRYYRFWEGMKQVSKTKHIEFLELDTSNLIVAIQNQALEWVNRYGAVLLEISEEKLAQALIYIEKFTENLSRPTPQIEDLKFVLSSVAEIQSSSMDMQFLFSEVIERYRTLHMYHLPAKPADVIEVNNLSERWTDLVLESKKRDAALLLTKRRFTEITVVQVKQFSDEIVSFRNQFKESGPDSPGIDLEHGVELLASYKQQLSRFMHRRTELVNAEKLFDLPVTAYPDLVFVETHVFQKLDKIYSLYKEQQDSISTWSSTRWTDLDIGNLSRGLESFFSQMKRFPDDLRKLHVYHLVEEKLQAFQDSLPLIASLKNDALRPRHWAEIMATTGVKFDLNAEFTLGKLFAMELNHYSTEINGVTSTALQEAKIEKEVQKIILGWNGKTFSLFPYKGIENFRILGDQSEIISELDDNMLNLTTMSNSSYALHFRDELRKWERDLSIVMECINVWMLVQRKWMYLEGIFIGSEDIKMQLPEASKAFEKVDAQFKKIMTATTKQPNVLTACTTDHRLDDLTYLSQSLERCQKSLSDYLENKRNAFSRFYFISDDELLSILGNSDPVSVQPHMLKMFDNCASIIFSKQNKFAAGMVSAEKESYEFATPVPIEGAVESWMNAIEAEMQSTLQVNTKEAVFNYGSSNRVEWIERCLGMVGLVGSQIWWTWEVEDAFRKVKSGNKHAMKLLLSHLSNQLTDLVTEIRKPDISSSMRKKVNTLIIIDVHSRDVIDRFVRDSILDEREFAWESQLRFYWDRIVDDISIKQCTGVFKYGYEYMGLNGRLVITPLTDRCYMTLTQALTFRMGGSPSGPAGTGKTETVKDLSKCLANPCLVTNCGEGLDYKAMGSIFAGLVQTGAWGCFDEFNRIDLEVLSVVSAQLRTIQFNMKAQKERFEFSGKEIKLNMRCGFFITMNPGYAGRTDLPDNLKALFRPVTMVVPDLLQICEIMLFSEGFNDAKSLAKKMTVLYRLSREQLSKQFHYDFGLRALKSVLVMAGALKRESSHYSEDRVLMRALRDMNLPKFVFEDVPLFMGLIEDLFPGLECPRTTNNTLRAAVQVDLKEQNLEHSDATVMDLQTDKIMQLYETMLTRHTSMIVGPTQGGKTTVLETLARAQLKAFGFQTKLYTLNPKAQPLAELYGVLDPVSRDWQDGILSKIFRETNEPLKSNHKEMRYIVFDGDVDALWVENMNSVMDDNKLLTLPNSERIRLNDHVRLLIEVADLQYASPATVSRVGMVYVEPKNLGFKPMYEKWIRGRKVNNEGEVLDALFERYVQPLILYAVYGIVDGVIQAEGPLKFIIPMVDVSLTKQLISLYNAILPLEEKITEDPDVIESIFIFCLIWTIGGALSAPARDKFDAFLKKLSNRSTSQNGASKTQVPSDSLYDNFFDIKSGKWIKWSEVVPTYSAPMPFVFSKVLVPTVDTVRYTFLLDKMLSVKAPVLFCGESGTSKTVTIQNFLNKLDVEKYSPLTINFSSRTSSIDVQRVIEGNVEKRPLNIYGPAPGKKLLIFIDDLNMPSVDKYGTQQPLALLKFLVERSFVYGRGDDLEPKHLRDLLYMAAMAPPGGGRNKVDPRVISLYSVFSITFPPEATLFHIYSSILTAHLNNFANDIQVAGSKITAATMNLYKDLVANLPPTPSKFHYIFNLRDLSRLFEGVLLSTPDKFDNSTKLVRLWRNECLRVFHDRLITVEDRNYVKNTLISKIIKDNWSAESNAALVDPILFGDYRYALEDDGAQARLYEDMENYEVVRKIFDELLFNYNSTATKKMSLVLFQDALEHMSRIHRIVRMPRGNALLVGVGGSGKQSLTKLVAYAAKYKFFEIQLTKSYADYDLREDLKKLYNILGTERGGSPVVFLFTDSHVKDEGFLELINNMLTSGIVPALFADEEKGVHLDSVRQEMTSLGLPQNKDLCWNFWVNRCRDNLHIVLCMSPASEALRRRCRNFPGLVNSTVIDWFFPWPEEALHAVASFFLHKVEIPDEFRSKVVNFMVKTHQSVQSYSDRFETELRRINSVTPKNYLDFIENYRKQLAQFRNDMGNRYKRLDGGLQKLIQAGIDVDAMRIDLSQQKIIVDAKSKECAAMIANIKESTSEVKAQQTKAFEKNEELSKSQENITREKRDAESALAEALPALEEAKAAVGNLDRSEFALLKAMKNPPELIVAVFQCVMELRVSPDVDPKDGWKGAQKMMSDAGFLNKLLGYEKDLMNPKWAKAVLAIIQKPAADPKNTLSLENVSRVSGAATGLLTWVLAVLKYHDIFKNVLPKQKLVKDLEKQAAIAMKELAEIKTKLESLQEQVNQLQSVFDQKNDELKELTDRADRMERQLTAAAKLIDGLGSERTRWMKDKDEINAKKFRLIGDCLLASAFLSYTGAFTFEYRHQMIYQDWLKAVAADNIPLTQPFRLENLLTTEVEMSRWASEGLPTDELSVQNGILTTRASRFPLCIDPQMQASKWIKEKENKRKKLAVHSFNDSDFVKRLELAIQFGNPFMFEGVDEELDPIIDPILEKALVSRGNSQFILLGDKEIEWDPDFRLYLITKMNNPHYSPEIAGKTMVINYMVTVQGLEDQLLNVVIGHEQNKLQKTKEQLIQTMSENNRMLVELESTLLKELTEATGNMLENANLISTLETAKSKSVSIAEQLEEMHSTAEEIEKVTTGYRPVAKRGSILYFSMAGLSSISKMYEHSLSSYLEIFVRGLTLAEKDPILPNRLSNIIKKLTKIVYDYVCSGTFEQHKLTYSFQMISMILTGDGLMKRDELDFFLRGNVSLDAASRQKPVEWISDSGWKDLQKLVELSAEFSSVIADLIKNLDAWKQWYDIENPEETPLPCEYSSKLTPFQHLLVYRIFRPDRVYEAAKNFITNVTNTSDYVVPPILNYETIFSQSSPTQPVVFILSPGADPMAELSKLAASKIGMNKFKFVALGQGQAPIATQNLEQGVARGYWVLLQNCHLMPSWLKQLEKILDSVKSPHPDFRLWMTTVPTEQFPIGILQRSFKVVTEPPDGLKLNMKLSFSKVTQEVLEECPNPAFRPLVYVLTFFHAVVQERRKYGKIGWNVPYDFNESDFDVSLKLLSMYLTKAFHESKDGLLPWGSLRYLIGEAMYGGRVTDAYDRRILVTYLDEYYGDFLFDENQPFYFARSGEVEKYRVPVNGNKEDYERAIENLPASSSPDVFGLHYNAHIGYSTNAVKEMWQTLILLQPRTSAITSGVSREEFISKTAADINTKIPLPFDLPIVRKKFEDIASKRGENEISPTTVVLFQELERWNNLIIKMSSSLENLRRALLGEMGMSNELDDLANSIFNGTLPDAWRMLAPKTQKNLGSWMIHFQRRYDQYSKWVNAGEDPTVMWLSGLSIPESYLTALVQSTCRKKKWPLDKSTLYTKVTSYIHASDIKERPEHGCYIQGLYLEGAAWDHKQTCLRRQDPKVLSVELPILQVIPIETTKLKLQNVFDTPIYTTQARTDAMGTGFVFKADLSTYMHPSHWVLQGAALVLNTDS